MIDKDKPIPLYIQIKNELLRKIKEGIWQVDSQIPTEKDLMREYAVGRATVREAVSLLVNEGYLHKRHGIGTFVTSVEYSLGFEPLISLTYSLKALGFEVDNIVNENGPIVPDGELLKKLKGDKKTNYYYLKRLRYVDNRPIAIEESYFMNQIMSIDSKFDLTSSLAKIILRDLKLNIEKIDQTILIRKASTPEIKELKIEDDENILELERWMYIHGEEKPFYYLRFIIPSDIYTYPFSRFEKPSIST